MPSERVPFLSALGGPLMRRTPAWTIWSASLHNRILYVTTVFGCGADKIDYVRVRVRIGRADLRP